MLGKNYVDKSLSKIHRMIRELSSLVIVRPAGSWFLVTEGDTDVNVKF